MVQGMSTKHPEHGKYTKPVLVRLTADQHEMMQRAADMVGIGLATWAREVLVKAARKVAQSAG